MFIFAFIIVDNKIANLITDITEEINATEDKADKRMTLLETKLLLNNRKLEKEVREIYLLSICCQPVRLLVFLSIYLSICLTARLPPSSPPHTHSHTHNPSLSYTQSHTHIPSFSLLHTLSHTCTHTHEHSRSVLTQTFSKVQWS